MKPTRLFALLLVLIAVGVLATYSSCKKEIQCPSTITFQKQTYNIVAIGDQCWFRENLDYEIGNSWCYDNDSANCDTYGRLYDWQTALGVCPSGWHLSSYEDWNELIRFLGGTMEAGGKLKEAGTTHWWKNDGGTNSSGFTALPGGYRDENGSFQNLTGIGIFWTSLQSSLTDDSQCFQVVSGYSNVATVHKKKEQGNSIRCIKD